MGGAGRLQQSWGQRLARAGAWGSGSRLQGRLGRGVGEGTGCAEGFGWNVNWGGDIYHNTNNRNNPKKPNWTYIIYNILESEASITWGFNHMAT